MKRSVILALAALAALALPSLAGAKEISKVELCGENGCEAITGAAANRLVGGDDMSRPPAAPGPYYRVELTAKAEGRSETWSIYYVPSTHRLALPDGNWQDVTGTVRAAYDSATDGLKPYPTPTLERVVVDGVAVHDPSSYLALFEAGSNEHAVPASLADWVPIEFRFQGQTPWSVQKPYVFYSPSDGLLQRGIDMVKLPDEMVSSISARESLASPDGFPWVIAVLVALTLALLAAGGIWLAARREWRLGSRRAPVPTT
jgi:hypothetical protein